MLRQNSLVITLFLGESAPGNIPSVPEMVYRVVRLPEWTEVTPVGSAYSHKAYALLHKKYPANTWA